MPATRSPGSRLSSASARATTSSRRTMACPSRSRRKPIHAAEPIVVVALGDSISEGSPGYDSRKGGDETSQWEHWAAQADTRLEFRNCGINGERTDEIMARLDECAAGAENLRAMVRRGKELGLPVLLVDLLPWNNGWPEAEPKIRDLNELIAEIARAEHVTVLSFHDTLEDPDRPGRMRQEWTSDGSHPSVEGYRRLGE